MSSTSTISFGVANCPSNVTTTTEFGEGLVTSSYALYENSGTGISFCYPSYLTITILPFPTQIEWPSGEEMTFSVFGHDAVLANSPIDDLLSSCEASGPNGDLSCTPPQDYQIIHAKSQNGFDYSIFWTNLANWAKSPSEVINDSAGPFAYIETPGDPVLIYPLNVGISSTVSMVQDLTVILNTLNVSKPL